MQTINNYQDTRRFTELFSKDKYTSFATNKFAKADSWLIKRSKLLKVENIIKSNSLLYLDILKQKSSCHQVIIFFKTYSF